MKVLGIDPGLKGALAFYDGTHLEVFDMPVHEITVNNKKKNRMDLYELARIIDSKSPIDFCIIEDVTASPQMGVTSSFSFGFSAGALQGVVAANFIPMERIAPRTWKKELKLTADKDSSRKRASEILPAYHHLWARAMDDGRAEAAILAYWYWNKKKAI